jgi:nitroimidazol reductase NimA-like FMN-containing flavoprotein (pyridoxamine 5'-phosphate oxidase superfamily)
MTTYASSQKVKNLRRDPRVSVLIESGEEYQELRGAVFYGQAEIIDDTEQVIDTLLAAAGNEEARTNSEVRDSMRKNASKRALIRVKPERIVSWDHSKLGGVY